MRRAQFLLQAQVWSGKLSWGALCVPYTSGDIREMSQSRGTAHGEHLGQTWGTYVMCAGSSV